MSRAKLIKELQRIKEEFQVINMKCIPEDNKHFLETKKYQCILKNGNIVAREKLLKGGNDGSAVIILPLTVDKKTVIIVEPRVFTKDGIGIELPAGYIEKGESPEESALRELREETGYVPKRLIPLISFYQDQGISSAYNHAFLALDCERKFEQDLDHDEYIKYLECSFNDLKWLVSNGFINDANGIITIEQAKKVLKR